MWLGRRVTDADVWIRIPSLVCGVALVPMVFMVGRRLVSVPAALAATGFVALSPFLVWYSAEARGYALLAVLVVGSTWALLVALERGGFWRWALLAVLVAATLLTHYTALFVIGAQFLWALWTARDRWRPLVGAHVAAAVGVAWWLPFAPGDNGAIAFLIKLTPNSVVKEGLRAVLGQPYLPVKELPAAGGLVTFGLATLLALAGAVVVLRSGRGDRRLLLVALLAVVTPVGLVVYSMVQPNIYVGRNLIPSLPYLFLLLGALLTALPRPLAIAGVLLALVGLGIGTARSYQQRYQRPDWKGAASYLNERVVNGDRVVELELFPTPTPRGRVPLSLRALQINLKPGIRSLAVPGGDPARLARAAGGHRGVWVVAQQVLGRFGAPAPPAIADGYRVVARKELDGLAPIGVYRYERR